MRIMFIKKLPSEHTINILFNDTVSIGTILEALPPEEIDRYTVAYNLTFPSKRRVSILFTEQECFREIK